MFRACSPTAWPRVLTGGKQPRTLSRLLLPASQRLCVEGGRLCLSHRAGEPVLVRSPGVITGDASENGTAAAYQWMISGHSVGFPGVVLPPSTPAPTTRAGCRAACQADARCVTFHFDAGSSTCVPHEESQCLSAQPTER